MPISSPTSGLPYKTWPVYTLAFLKTLYQSLFGLALPNYLIYNEIMDADLIGVVTSMTSLAYIITPFIGQILAKGIGYKNCLILSLIISAFSYSMQLIVFTPTIFITMQLLEGLSLGLFWPNLMMQVSLWQKVSSESQNNINFKKFNRSWNFGILGGYVIGFTLVSQFNNDFIALISAVVMVFLLIPVGFFVDSAKKIKEYSTNNLQGFDEPFSNAFEVPQTRPLDKKNSPSNEDHDPYLKKPEETVSQLNRKAPNLYLHIVIPAIVGWILNLGYTTSKSIFGFNFPFNLKSAGFESEWRYLFVFAQQTFQVIGLNLIGPRNLESKHRLVKMCLVLDLVMISSLIFFENIYIIIFATIFMGLTTGIKQGFVMKINFDHSAHTGESKYINIGEIVAGIGFGITPIWLGFLIDSASYRWSYLILLGLTSIVTVFYWMKMKKVDLSTPPATVEE